MRKLTTMQFIERAIAKHGTKYDYAKANYTSSKKKLIVTCKLHGDFEIAPDHHLQGCGCYHCGRAVTTGAKRSNTEQFISKARKVHGDTYSYDKVVYTNNSTKVIITCLKHGDFEQIPSGHLNGRGCPTCGVKKCADNNTMSTDEFIYQANMVHDNMYTYCHANYTGRLNNIKVTCSVHGDFDIVAGYHLSGGGCQHCWNERRGKSTRMTVEGFINSSKAVHDDIYDYSKVEFINTSTHVTIICPTHGAFQQRPDNHIYKQQGCPNCGLSGTSIAEQELFTFIQSICPDAINGDRAVLNGQEIDIYVPSLKVGIEYNGLYFHSTKFKQDLWYHQKKTDLAKDAGIRLIHIWEDEWLFNRDVIKDYLSRVLVGGTRKFGARQCKLVATSTTEQRQFLKENHLQGVGRGGKGWALTKDGEVLAVAIFAKTSKGEVELVRWCIKRGVDIAGGFSRVMKHAPDGCISYCDAAKFTGDGYIASGWEAVERDNIPQTFYVRGLERLTRQAGVRIAGGMSHAAIEVAGLLRLNGCRQLKFKWNIKPQLN